MGITFNADEIFAMAEEIERNGQKFYRKAAQNIVNDDIAQMLRSLADMEMDHEKTFADMRKLLRGRELEQNVFDPDNEIALYLQAMADGHVFDLSCEPAEQLIGNESIEDILKMAIAAEKDSIIFYVGLKDSVPENAGKDKINNIIKEEMNHITVLNQFMAALK
ncbi:MAG: ferritin family protein [Planctomycetes bacterium]|nr:ferritin family protein [Planctomycetota bacterium]